LLWAVIGEHCFIFIKAFLVETITDTPDRILESEHEQQSAIKRAEERILEVKHEKNSNDFEETKAQR
jgi:replicative DNA helicase